MMSLSKSDRLKSALRVAAVVGPALLLGGCFEGTEVNGKVFDLLGVSTAAQEKSRAEPKMSPRAGLVLPPDATRLPAPGSGEEASVAALNDPDKQRAATAVEKERLHAAYCSGDLSWKQRVVDKDATPTSPYGSCSAFTTGYGRPQSK